MLARTGRLPATKRAKTARAMDVMYVVFVFILVDAWAQARGEKRSAVLDLGGTTFVQARGRRNSKIQIPKSQIPLRAKPIEI
jgi:hypothetical protein